MTGDKGIEMIALMSRPGRPRGDSYEATAQEARDDERRGFGQRASASGDKTPGRPPRTRAAG